MNDLIIGGIYITQKENYLVVINTDNNFEKHYNIAFFSGTEFNQQKLQEEIYIPKEEYRPFYIAIDSDNILKFFNNGYCGRVTKGLLMELHNVFHPSGNYFRKAENLEKTIYTI